MTQGPPWQRIMEFAVPMLIGNLAQQLYNTADSIVVGKYVGLNALAAVGSASPILNLLLALFVGVSTGAGIVVSQYFGAGDREKLSRSIGNCITLAAIASIVSMVIGAAITMPLLRLLDTPASIIDWCGGYLMIFFLGSAGFTFYNILSGILRGMGDSFSALGFLLVATVLNIGMDVWFVAGFRMGVPGVALATVLAQGISAILCLIKLLRMREVFDLRPAHLRLRRDAAMRILRIGVPSGITQAIMSVAMLVVQSLTNSMGELVIACNVIIMRVDGFAMMPNMTFGQAMSVYTGQNVGAGKTDRVKAGLKQGTLIAVGFACVITTCLLFFNKYMFALFTDSAEAIDLAGRMMRIMAAGYITIAVTQVLGGIMRGAGDTVTPMWISLFTTIGLRVPVAYILAWFTRCPEWPNGRPEALSISLLVPWVLGAVISAVAFRRGKWQGNLAAQSFQQD
ncbi:MAG: MATE family efflux transporter [Oscillospiraceae bacterium]|nr:MATE family efflux transporter [Oscillospiraceae bacterium]MDE6996885.1 MATE family efflux transporter [Oscillospiraceae bacterium]